MTETNKLTTRILWVLGAAYAVALVANISFGLGIPIAVVLLISVAFALIHGAVRYGWTGIVAFVVISLVVSNILENTSILTGFPFGHYHYTDALGPKLFLVPVLIGVAYFANGYFAWVIGNVLIGELRRGSSALLTFAVPFIAAFVRPSLLLEHVTDLPVPSCGRGHRALGYGRWTLPSRAVRSWAKWCRLNLSAAPLPV